MSKEWFDKHITQTDDEFEEWWKDFYGCPDDYADEDEFWVRKAFAWYGWVAKSVNR